MSRELTFGEKQLLQADLNEKNRLFVNNAIELALSLGDFQKEVDFACSPALALEEAARRIEKLIHFEFSAIYLLDEESSDLIPCLFTPEKAQSEIEQEMEFMIENGFLAWALRERRGVNVFSRDGRRQILLHAMATYAHVRGFFIGGYCVDVKGLPDTSLEILSIILRNTANLIESIQFVGALKRQNSELEFKVNEKTQTLLRFERQLMQAQKMDAVASLAGGIAHQYNNALAGLIGHIDLLALTSPETEELKRFLKGAQPLTEKMTNLTHQLLSYAHGSRQHVEVVKLSEFISKAMPVLREIVKPTVRINTDLRATDLQSRVDLMQFQTVLSAVMNNADEAIEERGEICISLTRTRIGDTPALASIGLPAGDYASIVVQDNGKGMDSYTLNRIFEPFFSTKFEGRGLSMAAAHCFVQNHQGAIIVKSLPDEGTNVQLFLPLEA